VAELRAITAEHAQPRRIIELVRPTLHKGAERSFGPGDVVTLLPDAIHSVVNTTSASTLTIEVYGRNPDHTGRSRFDVDRDLEIPIASGKELVR
jgi:predicted metal-dependent enzyme (double-stranded beta helix superfamily)